ncbi:hypothetical protein ANN_00810 [Periplaneta americana]|uniref:Uncharacterized protein n=1 Tax=Periplaneta americana TaxID=6978 RepID=A0ABQ8TRT5_PERAM|nr:hypothetical protein ANN_00810 [Periplaneta americana]
MESLRNRIVAGCEEIRNTPGIWDRVRRAMRHRCEACIQAGGGHFEHLLIKVSALTVVATCCVVSSSHNGHGISASLKTVTIRFRFLEACLQEEGKVTNHNPCSEELTGSRQIHVEAELLHLFRIPRIPSVSFRGSPGLWQLCNVGTRGQDGIVRGVCVGSHKSVSGCSKEPPNCTP